MAQISAGKTFKFFEDHLDLQIWVAQRRASVFERRIISIKIGARNKGKGNGHPGAPVLRHPPGPISVAISVGTSTCFEKFPGNCEHRTITCFNLAWWLAKSKCMQNRLKDLYLVSMQDGHAWTALTKYA
ncbi:hypothetical protein B0H19DRAFT_1067075 [Mycena capillaripes]|nr:hypothetical protein B0H19DRAFT_1067075 [Mycena capillaripes]